MSAATAAAQAKEADISTMEADMNRLQRERDSAAAEAATAGQEAERLQVLTSNLLVSCTCIGAAIAKYDHLGGVLF